MSATQPRAYRMVRRAESTARTREAILDAATRAFWAEPAGQLTLEGTAQAAGVTVQTVIRHFGGRDGLFGAAVEREMAAVAGERDAALVSSPSEAVRQLLDHYERRGDMVIRLLAEEARQPELRAVVGLGRGFHRDWCARVFAGALAGLATDDHERRLAQLVAVCDVYTWKLLRRDAGLDRAATERALLEILGPLLAGA